MTGLVGIEDREMPLIGIMCSFGAGSFSAPEESLRDDSNAPPLREELEQDEQRLLGMTRK